MKLAALACLPLFLLPLTAQKPFAPKPTHGHPYNVTCTTLANGDSLCYGSMRMVHTADLSYRGTVFFAPAMTVVNTLPDQTTNGQPNVQVTIETVTDGNYMVPAGILVQRIADPAGDYLQINVTAVNPGGQPRNAEYECHLTIIGKVATHKR